MLRQIVVLTHVSSLVTTQCQFILMGFDGIGRPKSVVVAPKPVFKEKDLCKKKALLASGLGVSEKDFA